uniref:zinc finger protein isoform X1 n=1 Tax=Ciona intestinalis TaxID=7719 RepID=UPI000EF4CD52|nr:zinc finger protein isoform X1 [Ciona intestinalis]XP_026695220.1 zinc finger protein isoform X1 [Ciona intestinalis]|eukprot:XP_026695219.1 zinc finger protein isoform X1 [Ciona intestinalis]
MPKNSIKNIKLFWDGIYKTALPIYYIGLLLSNVGWDSYYRKQPQLVCVDLNNNNRQKSQLSFVEILMLKLSTMEKETDVNACFPCEPTVYIVRDAVYRSCEEFIYVAGCSNFKTCVHLCSEEFKDRSKDAYLHLLLSSAVEQGETSRSKTIPFKNLLAANFVVNHLPDSSFYRVLESTSNNLLKYQEFLEFCCYLLNRNNFHCAFALSLSNQIDPILLEKKRKQAVYFLRNQLNHKSPKNNQELEVLNECTKLIGSAELNKMTNNQRNVINLKSVRVFCFPNEQNIKDDGSVVNSAKDPPGQRSFYIPPGDSAMESYRLSTFMKYPQDTPVNPRHLATAGLYFTGYKDRVKCFCCGLATEQWQFGDDEKSPRWHRSNCEFIQGHDCGNIPIGSWGWIRPDNTARAQPPQPQQHNNIVAGKATSLQGSFSPPLGIPMQTATVVQQRRTPTFQRIELATISSVYHEQVLRSLDLKKEGERMKSFENWPTQNRTVNPSDLARSGFFYLGNLDRVQCFSCGGVLRNWNYGDNITAEHRRHFPHCRMTQGTESNNVPSSSPPEASNAPRRNIQEPPDPSESEQRELEMMFPCQHPVNSHMRHLDSRIVTFDSRWPKNKTQATIQQIAKAGFFYLGERDRVKCWYCNGGLQNWDPDDEPWTEHAKWFPTCEFLIRSKGPDFVHHMVSLYPNLPRPILQTAQGANGSQSSGTSSAPIIIDPQVEKRKLREKLNLEMDRDIVKCVNDMGFELKHIRLCVKRKLEKENIGFSSAQQLIDEILKLNLDEEEEEELDLETDPKEPAAMETEDLTMSMQDRLLELQNERKCKICVDKLSDIVFVPCGHLCVCQACKSKVTRCPICKSKVEKSIRTYMS